MANKGQNEDASLGRRDVLNTLLQQYVSVRGQSVQALAGQLSALSLGIAAIAVLVAGVGSAWSKAPLIASVGLMGAVPAVANFVLLLWATELKKTLYATSFLRRVAEPGVNALFPEHGDLLTWEREGWKYGRIIPYYVAIAVFLMTIVWASYAAGTFRFERLASQHSGWVWNRWWPVPFGVAEVLIPAVVSLCFIVKETRENLGERR